MALHIMEGLPGALRQAKLLFVDQKYLADWQLLAAYPELAPYQMEWELAILFADAVCKANTTDLQPSVYTRRRNIIDTVVRCARNQNSGAFLPPHRIN